MQRKVIIQWLLLVLPLCVQAQCIEGNCKEGDGIYIYQDHSIYIGRFENQKANGYGTCYYSTGTRYVGEWRDHEFHGKGTYFYEDGTAEYGNWEHGSLTSAAEWIDSSANREAITWAVIVGVSNYKHLKPLNYTDDDAYRVMAFLQSPQGGAVKDDHLRILVDDAATRSKVIKGLHDIVSQVGEKDRLMFYFSGHGFEDAFAPIDYDGDAYKLYHQEVVNIINNSLAKEKLCVIDACFSASMQAEEILKSNSSSEITQKYYNKFVDDKNKTAYIFSSQAEEASIEHRGLRQGVFSHFLLKGLKGEADADKSGTVTIKEVATYVEEEVSTYTNNYQKPIILNGADNETIISEMDK